jgi:hypothetical protein
MAMVKTSASVRRRARLGLDLRLRLGVMLGLGLKLGIVRGLNGRKYFFPYSICVHFEQ